LPLKGKKTVLLVTYQKQFLMECDKIIILKGGQIKEFDAPENIEGLEMYYSQ
jgi:ABC-type protease/lipase transport system fused ATPase/permease subunit